MCSPENYYDNAKYLKWSALATKGFTIQTWSIVRILFKNAFSVAFLKAVLK